MLRPWQLHWCFLQNLAHIIEKMIISHYVMGGLFGAVPDANWPGQKRSFSAQAKSASTKVPPGHICMWLCVCVTLRAHEITAIFVNGLLCIPGTQMTLLGVTLGRSTYQFGVPICLGQFTWSWTPCRQRTSSFLAGYKIWWSHENRQKLRSFSPSTNPYIQFNWLYHYLHTGE